MCRRVIVGGLTAMVLAGGLTLQAQSPRPLGPVPEVARIAPFFDGWYANPDGTISYSFGYSNLNKATVEIPLGPNNFITPKEYDGRQPTVFNAGENNPNAGGGANAGVATAAPQVVDAGRGSSGASGAAPDAAAAGRGRGRGGRGGGGGGANQYDRERGVFTVTVPGSFKGDVVWTLKYQGQTWTIPGRSASTAYQLSWPMAMGSTPPLLRFQEKGAAARGPMGLQGPALQARVGTPTELTVWVTDDAVHEKEPIPIKREAIPAMNVSFYKHAGPAGDVAFSPAKMPLAEPQGKVTTKATFREPGEYTLRVRADTFGNIDSTAADQCCWTNGYWKVTVTR